MKKLISFILFIIPIAGFSQSFVFCPEIKTEQKQGFDGLNINIVFKDSRLYEKKLIEKCTKDKIFSAFVSCITNTYPNIKINVLDENRFNDNPSEGIVTFIIDLLQYDATFYPAVYVANTKYETTLLDYRNGVKIFRDTISGSGNQFNALGIKSAKIASNSSFKRAFDQFILMFEKLKPSKTDGFTSDEALAELKKFKEKLDLQLITQEEYDIKKAELIKYIK